MLNVEAELSWAGGDAGVKPTPNEDGVTVSLEDPAHQEQVEREFRQAGPIEYAAGSGRGRVALAGVLGVRRPPVVLELFLLSVPDTLGYTSERPRLTPARSIRPTIRPDMEVGNRDEGASPLVKESRGWDSNPQPTD